MSFAVNGHDLRTFGSRGQQRTAALALKLAEVQMMHEETRDSPLLLLDDVMSELDAARRHTLLEALAGVSQAIVSTTDWSDFSPELRAHARTLRVKQGVLYPANPESEGDDEAWENAVGEDAPSRENDVSPGDDRPL